MKRSLSIHYTVHDSIEDLPKSDRELIEKAKSSTAAGYAPYSGFYVGAALRLRSGKITVGANQENGAFPSGLCAERIAMFSAGAQFPEDPFDTLAISAKKNDELIDKPVTPCGSCRQVMAEYVRKYKSNFRILLTGEKGAVLEIPDVSSLLPFAFNSDILSSKVRV